MIAEVSLFKSDPLPGRGEKHQNKSHLAVAMSADLCVINKHTIDPCSKGDKIIA